MKVIKHGTDSTKPRIERNTVICGTSDSEGDSVRSPTGDGNEYRRTAFSVSRRTVNGIRLLLFCIGLSLGTFGCGIKDALEKEFAEAFRHLTTLETSINRAISTGAQASKEWQSQSDAWRKAMVQLQKDFEVGNTKLLGETLRNTADHVIADAVTGTRADMDYVLLKLGDNLKLVAEAVRNARKELEALQQSKSKDKSRIQAILDGIANAKVWDDPWIVSFVPNHVDMAWQDCRKRGFTIASERRVEAHGWGFDRPQNQRLNANISIDGADDKHRSLSNGVISHTSAYLMQFTLHDSVTEFRDGDKRIVFQCGDGPNDKRQLPIKWLDVPPHSWETVRKTNQVPALVPKTLLLFWAHNNAGVLHVVGRTNSEAHMDQEEMHEPEYIRVCCEGVFREAEYKNLSGLPTLPSMTKEERDRACIRDETILTDPQKSGLAPVHGEWPKIMNDELWFIVKGDHIETVDVVEEKTFCKVCGLRR